MPAMSRVYPVLATLLVVTVPLPAQEEADDPRREPAVDPRIEIDRERGEIRFACRFVNPSRVLEVFGCHETGPSHETVVEFSARGPEIYDALLAIGCRNASWWNGASPDDFDRNQGDRLIVLVRWESGGTTREHAAEDMLTDGETGFPAFIRGFSFGARTPAAGKGIPRAVEITLGGTNRQRAVYSVLAHPTSLPRLRRWMLPPYLDTRVVTDHRELIEKGAPATLIIRKVKSEEELLEFGREAARRRGLTERAALYEKLLSIAREIDRLKAEYEKLLGEMRSLLASPVETAGEPEKKERARSGYALLARGRSLCARIQERYLALYTLEEAHKAGWIEQAKDIPEEERSWALLYARSCFPFEARIAAKEVEMARLAGDESLGPADRRILEQAIEKDIEALDLERLRLIKEFEREDARRRAKELDPADAYTRRLFEEDILRARSAIAAADANARLAALAARELRAMLRPESEEDRKSRLLETEAARKALALAELEGKLVDVLEETRWSEGDAEGPDPERKTKARANLEELRKKKAELEEEIRRAKLLPLSR